MATKIWTIPLFALLSQLAACEGRLFAPGESDPPIRTSAEAYVLVTGGDGWQTEIPITYVNESSAPYFLSNCTGGYAFGLEKRVDDRWAPGYDSGALLCHSPAILIEPGRAFSDTLLLFAGFPGNTSEPKFVFADPDGVYRIVLETLSSDPSVQSVGRMLPLEQRVSNEFRLVTAAQGSRSREGRTR